ncbi:cation:proton antiporter domain-containing protein [Calothrix sp. NIES-2098]|uniref:cation:proton antiporter domain-containing protein n=1 Tax=Calothrix sp. NIES-2098 TaxID=1954171 RepID=UPI000BBC6855
MGGRSVMEWILAQQTPLDSNSAVDSQTAGTIPELVIILIILLLIATAVALITQRLRIPYVTGLVLAGLPITELWSRRIGLDPSLVLNLFLPILIFEAAINTDISRLRSTFKPLLTVALALGTFQIGQFLGVSGAVAVVIAGLIFGNLGLPQSSSASDRITLLSFWEYAGFSVNTFIFLLIGIEINPVTLWRILPSILFVILAYQLGRILSVYVLLAGLRWFDRPIPLRWQHVLVLGNIKGSLSMALAVAIPLSLTGRDFLIELVFGSVLFSLVIQGLALPWLIKQLNISRVSETIQETGQLQIQLIAAKAAQDELDSLLKSGVLPKAVYEELWASYQARVAKSERVLRDLYNQYRAGKLGGDRSGLDRIRRRLLLAEKVAVSDALRKRIVPEDLVQPYIKDLDETLLSLEDD